MTRHRYDIRADELEIEQLERKGALQKTDKEFYADPFERAHRSQIQVLRRHAAMLQKTSN